MKTIYGTRQIAGLFKTSDRVARKWFDSGKLEGTRNPDTKKRLATREALIKFVKEYGLEMPAELQ